MEMTITFPGGARAAVHLKHPPVFDVRTVVGA
jgi:hypothetical protein